MPEGARTQLAQHAPGGAAPAPAGPAPGPAVQRQPDGSVGTRSSLGFTTMMSRVWGATTDKWGKLSVKEIVVDMLKTMIWPWPAVGHELGALWDDWKSSAHRLFAPRGDSFGTIVQDLWTNLLTLVDFPWAIVKHLVNIVGALMGWVTIILVGAGAIIFGAIGSIIGPEGTVAGAIFGAGAGLGVAGAAGAAVLAAFALTQTTDLVKRLAELFTAALTPEEQKEDVDRASDSAIALAVAAIMTAIIWIAGELAGAFLEAVRKIKAGPPKELPPPDEVPNSEKPKEAPVEKTGAPMRSGESPTQFGERLGGESKGKPSRFDYVVEEINKAGLTQEQAVEATTAATKAMGLRLVVVRQGPDVILSSVMPGDARPIVIAKPGGQVVRGVADIRIANPPSLDRPIVLENVREGAPGEPPTPNPPEPTPSGTYDPKTRTVEQLALDRDPTPRAGETPEQAQARAQAAQAELAVREAVRVHDALGERPPRMNMRAHEAENPGQAHTIERHGPDMPLKRGDAPAGGRTVEGRIYGDPPWPEGQNFSYKWIDEATMNRVVNEHLSSNWEKIRSDLAVNGRYEATFNQGNLTGEGFHNASYGTPNAPRAVYGQTSMVTITMEMIPGRNPPAFRIIRAFPNGRGF